MDDLTTDQQLKREAAHALAAMSDVTLWPNWQHPIHPANRKKTHYRRTSHFKIAQAHRPGHGRLS